MKHNKTVGLLFLISMIIIFYGFNDQIWPSEPPEKNVQVIPTLKEGVYKVEYDQRDRFGWRALFSMTVDSKGELTEVNYEYEGKNGMFKTKDIKYNNAMRSKNGIGPEDYCPRFEKNLLVYQNPDEVDAITGATHSSKTFKDFAKRAFYAAQKGDQTKIVVVQPEPEQNQEISLKGGSL